VSWAEGRKKVLSGAVLMLAILLLSALAVMRLGLVPECGRRPLKPGSGLCPWRFTLRSPSLCGRAASRDAPALDLIYLTGLPFSVTTPAW
jgi:hypothetical protein